MEEQFKFVSCSLVIFTMSVYKKERIVWKQKSDIHKMKTKCQRSKR